MALTTAPVELITLDDGVTITVDDNSAALTLKSTDADANTGPELALTRDSSSPADDDFTGIISFNADDDGGNVTRFALIRSQIKDASDGSEDGSMDIKTMVAGSERSRVVFGSAETNFKVCKDIKPADINELSDVVALARPAALEFVSVYKTQKEFPSQLNLNEELDTILSWSKNVILYQEQLMQIAHKVFGLTLEEAEILRRIVGKKKVDEMPKSKDRIYEAGRENNLDEEISDFYWNSLVAASHYSFNKSHSFAYADLAAKTVFLKHKYPQEFFLSILECACYLHAFLSLSLILQLKKVILDMA